MTSANHAHTRRNPVSGSRREAAIERFSVLENIESLVAAVSDTAPTERFADVTIKTVATTLGLELTPGNTVVGCSTPAVAALYSALGFRVAGVELDTEPTPERPWDVIEMLVADDPRAEDLAHPASLSVFSRYHLSDHVRSVFADPIVGSEGGLTETRAYASYARSFEDASQRKWDQIKAHVEPGRIVDIGCASGGLLERAGLEPRLHESDLIGIEVARHLFAEAEHRKAQGAFANPNTFFYQRNILAPEPIFAPASIDTTLTVALTHEIISYGQGVPDLRRFADAIFAHTRVGGVWVNSDVCGPEDPDRVVWLRLNDRDGRNIDHARSDLDQLVAAEVDAYMSSLSTLARFIQFAYDFPRLSGVPFNAEWPSPDRDLVQLTLRDAMEFMSRKDYTANWLSECHETFCRLSWAQWKVEVEAAGFTVDAASRAWRNDWLVENRFVGAAQLTIAGTREPLAWPTTHLLMVARRPL